jgi:hypothetical protein
MEKSIDRLNSPNNLYTRKLGSIMGIPAKNCLNNRNPHAVKTMTKSARTAGSPAGIAIEGVSTAKARRITKMYFSAFRETDIICIINLNRHAVIET